jgi:S-adenosylmethionine synthetase
MGGHGYITVSGEIKSRAQIDVAKIVNLVVGNNFKVNVYVTPQSPEISHGVDTGGAGDQGIMIGYACNETPNLVPLEYEMARSLCKNIYQKFPHDGKVQVTVDTETKKIQTVVASFQNTKTPDLLKTVKQFVIANEYLINPAGEWHIGGFDADSGLSGRKIVIDSYGPNVPIGGGSFSGKDYTKVDRSGAYMARKIAVDELKKNKASEVLVKLAYAIGKPQPVMSEISIDGKSAEFPKGYDLTPAGMKNSLQLDQAVFAQTSNWGHFGRAFPWDQ